MVLYCHDRYEPWIGAGIDECLLYVFIDDEWHLAEVESDDLIVHGQRPHLACEHHYEPQAPTTN
jgi:hypothetical protein